MGGCRWLHAVRMSLGRVNRPSKRPLEGCFPAGQTAVEALGGAERL